MASDLAVCMQPVAGSGTRRPERLGTKHREATQGVALRGLFSTVCSRRYSGWAAWVAALDAARRASTASRCAM